jgi:hypothetical protein
VVLHLHAGHAAHAGEAAVHPCVPVQAVHHDARSMLVTTVPCRLDNAPQSKSGRCWGDIVST